MTKRTSANDNDVTTRKIVPATTADGFLDLLKPLVTGRADGEQLETLWNRHADLIDSSSLAGLVYSKYLAFAELHAKRLNPPEAFRRAYFQNTQMNAVLTDEVKSICAATRDLKVAVIQGMAFLARYRPDPGSRSLGDIDFLVSRADLPEFVERLTKMGYRHIKTRRFFHWDYDGHAEMTRSAGRYRLNVDVTSSCKLPVNLMSDTIRLHLDRILESVTLTPDGIPVPSPAHLLLLNLLNVELKEFSSLKGYLDIVFMTQRKSHRIDWGELEDMVDGRGARHIAAAILNFCRTRLGAEIPMALIERLASRIPWFTNNWLNYFLDPTAILMTHRRGVLEMHRFPSMKTIARHTGKHFTAFGFTERETQAFRLIHDDFDSVNAYVYKARHPVLQRLFRWVVNPILVLNFYLASHIVYTVGGAVHYYKYGGRPII